MKPAPISDRPHRAGHRVARLRAAQAAHLQSEHDGRAAALRQASGGALRVAARRPSPALRSMRPALAAGLLPLALGAAVPAAAAADPAEQARLAQTPADCVPIPDAAARLACYDRLLGRPEAVPVPLPAQGAPQPRPAATAVRSPVLTGDSYLTGAWDLDDRRGPLFAPRAYRPTYVLPATWTDRVNRTPSSPSPGHTASEPLNLRPVEAKYQLSLKAKFAADLFGTGASLWGGYTQSSRWQVYNGPESRPFRETDYEPELVLVQPLGLELLGWKLRMASLSLNHQSNGRSLPLSRSWNRWIAGLSFERGDWVAELRPWNRIDESAGDDDNPDISDFVGRGELRLARYAGDHAFLLQLRHTLRGGERSRGSALAEWVFPLAGQLHGYLQLFGGYGESLIDYNLAQTRVGLGVTIAGWR